MSSVGEILKMSIFYTIEYGHQMVKHDKEKAGSEQLHYKNICYLINAGTTAINIIKI